MSESVLGRLRAVSILTIGLLVSAGVVYPLLLQAGDVREIEIHSAWQGWGTQRTEFRIVRAADGRYLRERDLVSPSLVDDLMSAVFEPVISKPQLENLRITQRWLQAHAETALRNAMKPYSPKPGDRTKFMRIFSSPDRLKPFVSDIFCGWHTDDAPSVAVTVVLENGAKLTVRSNSQHLFMLPWSTANGQTTYNADIPRAVSALMPPKSTNQERMTGKWLADELAQTVLWEMNHLRRFSCMF